MEIAVIFLNKKIVIILVFWKMENVIEIVAVMTQLMQLILVLQTDAPWLSMDGVNQKFYSNLIKKYKVHNFILNIFEYI